MLVLFLTGGGTRNHQFDAHVFSIFVRQLHQSNVAKTVKEVSRQTAVTSMSYLIVKLINNLSKNLAWVNDFGI